MRCTGGIASRAIVGVVVIVSFLGPSLASGQINPNLYTGVATDVQFSCDDPVGVSSRAGASFEIIGVAGEAAGGMNLGLGPPTPADHAYGFEATVGPPGPDAVRSFSGRWGASVVLGAGLYAAVDPDRTTFGGRLAFGTAKVLFVRANGTMEHFAEILGLVDSCQVAWKFQGQSRGIPPNPPTGVWGLCNQGVELKARAPASGGSAPQWVATTPCARGTTCFAVPGSTRADLLVRLLPLGGGRVGPAILPLSASSFDVWTRDCGQSQQTRSWLIPAATTAQARPGLLDLVGHRSAPASIALDEAAAPEAALNLELEGLELAAPAAPPPPPSPWLTTTALPGFRFKALLAGTPLVKASACAKEAICLARSAGNAPDVVVRVLKKQSNGKRWSSVGKFAQPAAGVWIEQVAKHVVKYYALPARSADSPLLPGVLDRTAFAP